MCVNCLNKVLCFDMLWLASRRWSLVGYSCSGIVKSLKTYIMWKQPIFRDATTDSGPAKWRGNPEDSGGVVKY